MIVVICGPTCTGKTLSAIKLCQKFNGEIISADSRQIYKGMDVGTNKVTKTKKQKNKKTSRSCHSGATPPFGGEAIESPAGFKRISIPIYAYDIVKPDEKFSAYDFAQFGRRKITEIQKRGKIPFIVGGTGFYIDALLDRVKISGIGADWELREELNQKSLQELQEMLQELDPRRYQNIDKSNKIRLIRAIEIAISKKQKNKKTKKQKYRSQQPAVSIMRNTACQQFGPDHSALSSWPRGLTAEGLLTANYNLVEIGLTASRKILYQKTDQWVDDLIEQKFLDEVQKLIDQGYRSTAPMQGMIYKSGIDFLEKRLSKNEMLERIKFDMHGYIRRQITYFKRNKNIVWFDVEKKDFDKKIEKFVELKLEEFSWRNNEA